MNSHEQIQIVTSVSIMSRTTAILYLFDQRKHDLIDQYIYIFLNKVFLSFLLQFSFKESLTVVKSEMEVKN